MTNGLSIGTWHLLPAFGGGVSNVSVRSAGNVLVNGHDAFSRHSSGFTLPNDGC
jgi:hypothetical protein